MSVVEQLAVGIAALDQRIDTLEAELARAYRVHQGALEPGKAGRFDVARRPEVIEQELHRLRLEWLDLHDELTLELQRRDVEDDLHWLREEVED